MRAIESFRIEDVASTSTAAPKSLVDLATAAPTYERSHTFGTNSEVDAMLDSFSLSDSVVAQAAPEKAAFKLPKEFVVTGAVSDGFKAIMDRAVNSVPKAQIEVLANKKYKIWIMKDASEYEAKINAPFANKRPEGYPAGWNWSQVDCLFDPINHRVVVFENVERGGRMVPSKDVVNIPGRFRHEFGHALDDGRGLLLQNDKKMQNMYEVALKSLEQSPVTKSALGYYLPQPDTDKSVGLRETIAGLYSIMHGGGTDSKHVEGSLKTVFRDMLDYMKKKGY